MKRICLIVVSGLLLSTLPHRAQGADSAYSTGVAQYNARQYAQAIQTFSKLLQSQPSATVALYLANSYFAARQSASAIQYYDWIVKAYPQSREAASAKSMLQRLGAGSSSSAGASDSQASSTTGSASGKEEPLTINFVQVKSLGNHPRCTQQFIDSVKDAIKEVPPGVFALAARHQCSIYITPTMIDLHPELQNTRPDTYEQGGTFKDCPAMFERPNVIVAQYVEDGDGWRENGDALGSLRHEFGHAVDAFMGYPSKSESFRHTYEMERTPILNKPDARRELQYYVQETRDQEFGCQETWAEACSIIFGGASSDWRKKKQVYFETCFPGVMTFIKQKISKLTAKSS